MENKHIETMYHLIHEIVMKGNVAVKKITSMDNLIYPFMKTLFFRILDGHKDNLGVRCVLGMLYSLWKFVGIEP